MKRILERDIEGTSAKEPEIIRPEPKDMLNRRGAAGLAKRFEKYWHDRGYHSARFWIEPIAERFAKVGTYEIYRVACNLVNGLPPVYRDQSIPK